MKLRRMKLVALAMSALMVTSALPMTAFAEEDVFFEEVADEALVGESADEEFYIEDEDEEFFFEEETEEDLVGGETQDGNTEQATSLKLDESTVKFILEEGDPETVKVTFTRKSADGTKTENDSTIGTKGDLVPATCEEGEYFRYYATIDNLPQQSEKVYTNGKAGLGHNLVYTGRSVETKAPTCTETGIGYRVMKCSRTGCDYEEIENIPRDIDKVAHKWVDKTEYEKLENIKKDDKGNPVFGTDGIAVLENDQFNGKYTVVTYQECSVCKTTTEKTKKEVPVYAKEQLEEKVIRTDNIENGTSYIGKKPSEMPKDELTYVLEDCTKEAYYIIGFFAKNPGDTGEETCIAEEKVTIKPHHHIVKGIAFKDEHDEKLCTVKFDKDGKPTVTNNSCYLDVTYKEVDHCDAPKCKLNACKTKKYIHLPDGADHTKLKFVEAVEKVAPHSGPHRINNEVKEKIAAKAEWNYDDEKDKDGNVIEGLDSIAKDVDSAINLKDLTATCTEAGTVTVEYKCKVCGEVIETQVVKVKALGHKRVIPVRENVVAPKCTEKGSYDAVVRCERCGIVIESRHISLPKIPHSNVEYDDTKALVDFVGSVVVDDNSKIKVGDKVTGKAVGPFSRDNKNSYIGVKAGDAGAFEDFFVTGKVFTLCDMCRGNENINADAAFEITVDEINKSEYSCVAGTITLTAKYTRSGKGGVVTTTKTFPYFTSVNAYQGRSQHDPETLADGTVKCKVCGTEIKKGSGEQGGETSEECKHENIEAVTENVKDATCTEGGSYDVVTKCKDCEKVISTMHVVTPANGHDFGSWQTSKKATVFATGTQKRTCAHCKKAETKTLAKLPSIIKLNKTAVTVKVGKSATVKVSKWNLRDYIAPTAEGGVKASNKNISAFKTGSYTLKIKGKKAGSSTVTVKMKAGATATIKVTVKK